MTPWIKAAAKKIHDLCCQAGYVSERQIAEIIERECQAASNAALGIEQRELREEWRGE